jgi:hypothetical protein
MPADQPGVRELVPADFRRYRRYRYYFSIVFTRQGRTGGAVLLAADSDREMDALGRGMATAPDETCPAKARNCIVFPNTSTASVLIGVTVNGEPRWINGGLRASALNARATRVAIARNGAVIRLDPAMREWFITTLLPGDVVTID